MEKLPDDFTDALRRLYDEETWKVEGPVLLKILPLVLGKIDFNYSIIRPLARGGSGVVILVKDKNLERQRVLKISRPSPGKQLILANLLEAETVTLLRLSHQNLISIFARGHAEYDATRLPFYIMEYMEDVKDADVFLEEADVTHKQVFRLFSGVLSAVEYLHAQGAIHLDIKPGNILVTPDGTPVLSDFGFAKWLNENGSLTLIGGTEGYMHPDAQRFVQEIATDPDRLSGKAPRELLRTEWDLFSLGKTFLAFLRVLDQKANRVLQPYVRRYLRLMACRLLDGKNTPNERAIGLALPTFEEIKYKSATNARDDLDKLIGTYDITDRVPELNLYAAETIQASTLATTPFTPRVRAIVEDALMQRLATFTQLGLLNLIYPSANHNRREHSIGTFSVVCRYILALYHDPLNPLFRQLMAAEDLEAALLAALLHDVGQYPLAHDIEEADSALHHHAIGLAILRSGKLLPTALELWEPTLDRVAQILDAKVHPPTGGLKDRILHSLIDGPIDADKMDYLMRDCSHLGLTFANGIDLERLLRCLTIVFRDDGTSTYAALGIHEKGKIPAEALAFARYAMFGQVYWHHAFRAMKTMTHRMVWEMLAAAGTDAGRTGRRVEFRRYVERGLFEEREEPLLFSAHEHHDLSMIHSTDRAVLQWIADQGGSVGRDLWSLLGERKLFKRILVLSEERAGDKDLWTEATRFCRRNRRNWEKRRQLQIVFQDKVTEAVEDEDGNEEDASGTVAEARARFVDASKTMPTVLVDVPPEHENADQPLEFIVEEDRDVYTSDEIRTSSFETSTIWKSLRQDFYRSIGKVRVFGHPDHSKFLRSHVGPDTIQKALRDALREVSAS